MAVPAGCAHAWRDRSAGAQLRCRCGRVCAACAHPRPAGQVAERALAQTATGLDVHFLGNAPAAHLATPKETVFFMRASYLGGSPRPTSSGVFTGRALACARRTCSCGLTRALMLADWAWVTKGELTEYVGKDVQALVQQAL